MGMWRVNVATTDGVLALDLDDEERSIGAQHINAITFYRDTGNSERLAGFSGLVVGAQPSKSDPDVLVGGHELEADPKRVEALVSQHQLDFEDFYES